MIALTSAHYVHTASDHAGMMLDTARQLAAGMGAAPSSSSSTQPTQSSTTTTSTTTMIHEPLGNAPLGLWVGEKFHELYLRKGQSEAAKIQFYTNERLRRAVELLPTRYVVGAGAGAKRKRESGSGRASSGGEEAQAQYGSQGSVGNQQVPQWGGTGGGAMTLDVPPPQYAQGGR